MIINFDPTGTIEGIQTLLEEMLKNEGIKGFLVLACDENHFTPDTLDDTLKAVSLPLFGGIFPAVIHDNKKMDKGTIVVGLHTTPDVYRVTDLSTSSQGLDEAIEKITPASDNAKTMFVFIDGYSQKICSLIDSLYTIFGLQFNYIGGGAGSINPSALDMTNTPCIMTNNGLIKDSAVLALVDIESGVGASHGWHKISGPYKVTETSGNEIKSLDWRPAFELYKEVINKHCGKTITNENFFDVAKSFPFGISRLGSEIIVRDPFTVEGDSLIVATEIPQESFVDILAGNTESIIHAAKLSYKEARDSYHGESEKTILLIDCISRALFLGDDFDLEIEAVRPNNLPLIGVLSLGEIANSGKSYMELYNKTCVVGILSDQ